MGVFTTDISNPVSDPGRYRLDSRTVLDHTCALRGGCAVDRAVVDGVVVDGVVVDGVVNFVGYWDLPRWERGPTRRSAPQ